MTSAEFLAVVLPSEGFGAILRKRLEAAKEELAHV